MRGDLGITYDLDVLRLIDAFRVIRTVRRQRRPHAVRRRSRRPEAFRQRLKELGVKTYRHYPIEGYPNNTETIVVSEEGYGRNEYIQTSRSLVVVTAPGPGSGKMAVCLSQLYHENLRGVKAGYAKFETFPIWNLPLKHPVNVAYEAATVDLNDVNMIDPFHLEAYGETVVNYNRDIEIFPVLNAIFKQIYGGVALPLPDGYGREYGGQLHRRRRRLPQRLESGDHPPLLPHALRRPQGNARRGRGGHHLQGRATDAHRRHLARGPAGRCRRKGEGRPHRRACRGYAAATTDVSSPAKRRRCSALPARCC